MARSFRQLFMPGFRVSNVPISMSCVTRQTKSLLDPVKHGRFCSKTAHSTFPPHFTCSHRLYGRHLDLGLDLSPNMDPPPQDKAAFFTRLEQINEIGDDDNLSQEEEAHAAMAYAYKQAAKDEARSKTAKQSEATEPTSIQGPQKTANLPVIPDALNPNPKRAGKRNVITMESTPNPAKHIGALRKIMSASAAGLSTPERPMPDFTRSSDNLILGKRSSTVHPTRSMSSLASTSFEAKKRKRELPVILVPASRQCFKNLNFFYVPNDDVDPKRKIRINKARQHGATWVRSVDEATHVTVDEKLKYEDIKSLVPRETSLEGKIVVNERYQVDCVLYAKLLDPAQKWYQVPGKPLDAKPATPSPTSSQDHSQPSLEIKKGGWGRPRKNLTPSGDTQTSISNFSSQDSQASPDTRGVEGDRPPRVDRAVTSHQIRYDSSSYKPTRQKPTTMPSSIDLEAVDRAAKLGSQDRSDTITEPPKDELSEIIQMTKDKHEGVLVDEDARSIRSAASSSGGTDRSNSYTSPLKKRSAGKNTRVQPDDTTSLQESFQCMRGGIQGQQSESPNAKTMEVLSEILDYYESIKDTWRILSYRRAITALGRQKLKITTYDEAVEIPGIGKSIAEKIEEIHLTNRLKKLEHAMEDPTAKVLGLFTKIHGVGLTQANKWVSQGLQTLDDLKDKAKLNKAQKIGLDHFHDLNTRILHMEVEALGNHVIQASAKIDAQVQLTIMGSYRRGAQDSGDIDLIISKPGTTSAKDLSPFLETLVTQLSEECFLTAAITTWRGGKIGNKWMGCCVLPEAEFPGNKADYRPIWRRIDLLLVPETEHGAAMIYFTGNDIFNRSMRLLASKKGLRLNEKGLYRDMSRTREKDKEKFAEDELLEGRDEKRIFELLGVTWREPAERWC